MSHKPTSPPKPDPNSAPTMRKQRARWPAPKESAETPSTARLQALLAQPVRPLSAQELADETLLQRKPRTAAQGRRDKQLLEAFLQRNEKPSSPATPAPPTDESSI